MSIRVEIILLAKIKYNCHFKRMNQFVGKSILS